MTVRNSCVARGQTVAGTGKVLYTVPNNFVLLLKDIRVGNIGTVAGNLYLSLHAADGSVALDVYDTATVASGLYSWSGWIALNGGDFLYMLHTNAAAAYWLSGALLPYATP